MQLEKEVSCPGIGSMLWDVGAGTLSWGVYTSIYGVTPTKDFSKESLLGDGQPMIVNPGFLADDSYTLPFRNFFENLGYYVYGWDNGRNYGNLKKDVHHTSNRIREISDKHEKPVILVGWSLGGVYAREAAKENRDIVDSVFTLGSPFNLPLGPEIDSTPVMMMFRRFSGIGYEEGEELKEKLRISPGVSNTSFYTRQDGIVSPEWCIQEGCSYSENIEVDGPHTGIIYSSSVAEDIASRLKKD